MLNAEAWKIEQARYGLPSGPDNTRIYPWVRSENIIKNLFTRSLIRNNRCLVPANGFFIGKGESTLFIYFPKNKIVTFGGVWQKLKTGDAGSYIIVFSIISRPAYGTIARITRRIPLVVHSGGRRKFLKKERPLMDITRMIRKEYNLEFNGIPVSREIFTRTDISKRDFYTTRKRILTKREFPEKEIMGSYYYYQS